MKSDTSGPRSPIFIHSLWRSSSTYFFNKFRAAEGYFAYQEPLHEVALTAAGNPEILNKLPPEAVRALRHPDMSQGHFHELFLTHRAWKDHIHRDAIYRRYFDQRVDADLNAFFGSLIDIAPDRPVIQECRTSLRIRPIKESLGGFHIALVRNPWDQWWSFKATAYFEAILQLLLQSENLPPTLQWTRELIGFREFHSASLNDEIAHFTHNPLDHKASYRIFFTLWCLAWLHARSNADLTINVDTFGASLPYRRRIVDDLSRVGIDGVDFEDCKSFLTPSASGSPVFREIEQSVLLQIRLDGAQASDIAELKEALEQFTRVRAEHLREGGTAVALKALDRREETILLLQDGEHQLAAFYGGELERANAVAEGVRHELAAQQQAAAARETQLSDERAAAFARAEHFEAQLQQHSARVDELIEEQHKQAIEREALETALAERSAASEARIHDLQDELGTTRTALDHANEELDRQGSRLSTEISWRDAKLAEANHVIHQIRAARSTFLVRTLRQFTRIFFLPANRALDNALVGWQLAPTIVAQRPPETHSDHCSMNHRPSPRATSLEDLCAFHDLAFVRCAYMTLLHRPPDPAGEAYYLGRIRNGMAKLHILKQIRKSAEGRNNDPQIVGLDRAIIHYSCGNLPIIGPFIRLFTGAEGNGLNDRRFRIFQNELSSIREELHSIGKNTIPSHSRLNSQNSIEINSSAYSAVRDEDYSNFTFNGPMSPNMKSIYAIIIHEKEIWNKKHAHHP